MSFFKQAKQSHDIDFSVIVSVDMSKSNSAKNVDTFLRRMCEQTIGGHAIQVIFMYGDNKSDAKKLKGVIKNYADKISVDVCMSDFPVDCASRDALRLVKGKYVCVPELGAWYSKKTFESMKEFFEENNVPVAKVPVFVKGEGCIDRMYLTNPKIVNLYEKPKYATLDLHSCFFKKECIADFLFIDADFAFYVQKWYGRLGINSKAKYTRKARSVETADLYDLKKIATRAEKTFIAKLGGKAESAMLVNAAAKFAYENGIDEVQATDNEKVNPYIEKINAKIAEIKRDREYDYKISVIVPVYKVEKYVEETFASIRRQNIGFFENIQVIFVDDGSPDKSGEICDKIAKKHPENVICIHKENGGVASARNMGLDHVKGKYVTFCDPDDYYKHKSTFTKVYDFFEKHYDEIDLISLPIMFFEGKVGAHPLNKKFESGTRVIDLEKEPWAFQLSITTAFSKAETIKNYRFNTSLRISEDAEFTLRMLEEKMKLGVCEGVPYMYRIRSDNSSAIQNSLQKIDYFRECMTDYMFAMIDYYKERRGYVPDFLKCVLAYEIQWRVTYARELTTTIMDEEQAAEYVENVKKVLSYIDDELIASSPYANFEKRYKMLEIKGTLNAKTELLWQHPLGYKYVVTSNGLLVGYYSANPTKVHFADIEDGHLIFEGTTGIVSGHFENVKVKLTVNGEDFEVERLPEFDYTVNMWAKPMFDMYAFRAKIDISKYNLPMSVNVVMVCDEKEIIKTTLTYLKNSRVNSKIKRQYYYKDGYAMFATGSSVIVDQCDDSRREALEALYERAFSKSKRFTDDEKEEIISLRQKCIEMKPTIKKPIWLVCDRVDKADDNGEAFFKYLVENHADDVDAYFVLNRDSSDFERMSKMGRVVETFSYEHKLLSLLADKIISSSANENTIDAFHPYRFMFQDLYTADFIFLQHGVLKGDLSEWLRRTSKNIKGFVTSAKAERDPIICRKSYGYSEDQVWLTGLPRFDRLYHDEKKLITVIPTWRKYLVNDTDFFSGERAFNSAIYDSEYLKFYTSLLTNEKLLSAAEKYGYTLQFMPHPQMVSLLPAFKFSDKVKVLDHDTCYRVLYAESDLMVTDYSSAIFDFIYLRKPIIYAQFDRDEFYSGNHNYEKPDFDDDFGEIELDLDSTIDRIIEYMQNGCRLKDKYRERIDNFFAFNDKGSCERIYRKIIEMD